MRGKKRLFVPRFQIFDMAFKRKRDNKLYFLFLFEEYDEKTTQKIVFLPEQLLEIYYTLDLSQLT